MNFNIIKLKYNHIILKLRRRIEINQEVIVKYNGDINHLKNELGVSIDYLGFNYAVISSDSSNIMSTILEYPQIEHIEEPFLMTPQNAENFTSTGIFQFKHNNYLSGNGVIIGIIDSGIDYMLPQFRYDDGTSKILYYWDQSLEGSPPDGFIHGSLYTSDDVNNSIKGINIIPTVHNCIHGTHVSCISAEIAHDANIIAVRVGIDKETHMAKSSDFMRAIKFILDKSMELKMPVVINISYGSSEGTYKGLSLFEQYIDVMCNYSINNIVIAAGNNGDKGRHKTISLSTDNNKVYADFNIAQGEYSVNLSISSTLGDDFSVYLVSPDNHKSQEISLSSGVIKNMMGGTKLKGYPSPSHPSQLLKILKIQLTSESEIIDGTWKLVFVPKAIVNGNMEIYMWGANTLSSNTKFVNPSQNLTLTIPATAIYPVTVGSFDPKTDLVSPFSSHGDIIDHIYKPDFLCPGENIIPFVPGEKNKPIHGTSVASAHATGVIALLLQWGITLKNDLTLYGQKMKAVLCKNAKRDPHLTYPNDSMGYGLLDLNNLDPEDIINNSKEDYIYDKNYNRSKYNRQLLKELGKYDIGYNIINGNNFEQELGQFGDRYRYIKLSDRFGIVFTYPSLFWTINDVLSLPSVLRSEYFARMTLLSEVKQGISQGTTALELIGANYFKNNPNVSITGRGVYIAILDTGIDYLHEDFIYPDRTSKIAYLWDQTKDGKPPSGYLFGSEYTKEDINKAIQNNDSSLSVDEVGSGTMLSGICAGLGSINKEYAGVAEDAELIVVKLRKINGYYNNSTLYAAMEYAMKKGAENNTPVVLNISIGTNNMIQLNSRIIEERTFFTSGLCIVAAAGNEGNAQTHTSGVLKFKEDVSDIEIEIAEDEKELEIQVIISRPDKVRVGVVSPSNEVSRILDVANYIEVSGLFDMEGTEYLISYIYPTLYSGQQLATITLLNVKKGIWKIRLIGQYITSGKYDIYLPNRVFLKPGTKFRQPNPNSTINYPAVYEDIIAVGTYDSKNNNLWPQSSRGPNIDGGFRISIVSPGVDIIAPYPGNQYATITGSAPAAAYTSGAVALYLQYTLIDNRYPDRGFVQQVRTYLQAGATRYSNIIYPNNDLGYGVLNIRGMFEHLK